MKPKPPRIDRTKYRRVREWRHADSLGGRPLPKTSKVVKDICGECGSVREYRIYAVWAWISREPIDFDALIRHARRKTAAAVLKNFEQESTFLKNLSAPGGY